jgi:hypothetical protein
MKIDDVMPPEIEAEADRWLNVAAEPARHPLLKFSTPFPNADTHAPRELIKRSVATSAREGSSRQASI